MADPERNAYWYNQRWLDFARLSPEQEVDDWRTALHPDHASRVLMKFERSLHEALPWEDTVPLQGRDGQYRRFLTRVLPLRGPQAQVERWFCTHTDVTEQIGNEQALRLRQEQLLAGEAVLEAADSNKNIFIATLAHDGTDGNTGLGLGLALTRNLLEKHGGSIVATSEGRGRGAEFRMLLPLADACASTPVDADVESRAASTLARPVISTL